MNKKKVLVTGASGFIGKALCDYLEKKGHLVLKLAREKSKDPLVLSWDPELGKIPLSQLEGFEAVFHLAGKNIARLRWTKRVKQEIYQSRIRDTHLLCKALSQLQSPPSFFLSASGVGYYGDRREEEVTEKSKPGRGVLSSVCQDWERASGVLEEKGCRVVRGRFGVVLSLEGGMLQRLRSLSEKGISIQMGQGLQWMSWIYLKDLLDSLYFSWQHPHIQGSVNYTTVHPVRHKEFISVWRDHFPSMIEITLPSFLVSLLLGDMGRETLLSGVKAYPHKLLEAGYVFQCPRLEGVFC